MATNKTSKAAQVARDQGLILGIPKRLANAQLLVEGTTYTATSAVALLQARVTAASAAVTGRAAYLAAVKAADAEETATAATVSGLVEVIYVAFGDDPAALADFGLVPRKKGVMTPAQRLAAAAKAKATRAARHTTSAKQKAAITGATPSETVSTPEPASGSGVVAPATPATPAQK